MSRLPDRDVSAVIFTEFPSRRGLASLALGLRLPKLEQRAAARLVWLFHRPDAILAASLGQARSERPVHTGRRRRRMR